MDPKILQDLFYAVGVAAIGFFFYAARLLLNVGVKYLEAKTGQTQFDSVTKYAETTVRYLEQAGVFKALDGPTKFKMLRDAIAQFAASKGIPIGTEDIDKVGEAAVRVVKKEIGAIDWGTNDAQVDETLGKVIDDITGTTPTE